MDNKVFRSFGLAKFDGNDEKEARNVLQMFSQIDGEYGPLSLRISAEIEGDSPLFVCRFVETSAASPDVLHSFRQSEIMYFCSFILPLFNPLSLMKNEVPFSSSQEPSNS